MCIAAAQQLYSCTFVPALLINLGCPTFILRLYQQSATQVQQACSLCTSDIGSQNICSHLLCATGAYNMNLTFVQHPKKTTLTRNINQVCAAQVHQVRGSSSALPCTGSVPAQPNYCLRTPTLFHHSTNYLPLSRLWWAQPSSTTQTMARTLQMASSTTSWA